MCVSKLKLAQLRQTKNNFSQTKDKSKCPKAVYQYSYHDREEWERCPRPESMNHGTLAALSAFVLSEEAKGKVYQITQYFNTKQRFSDSSFHRLGDNFRDKDQNGLFSLDLFFYLYN